MDTDDFNTSRSNLWVKLRRNFGNEINARYAELRSNGWFTLDRILYYFEDQLIGTIGETFYNQDQEIKYMDKNKAWVYMCNGARLEHTKRWLEERLNYLDSVFEYGEYLNSIVMRSNVPPGNYTLRVKTYSPQFVEISFSDQATGRVKKYCDKDKWYEFSGVIQNAVDNNIPIKGAANVMYIEGMEMLNVSSMLMSNAKKLVTLDISGSTNIQNLELGSNEMLQTLNLKNCVNLGINNRYKSLDVTKCLNLKYLDCSNTKIGEVQLNPDGGSLEYFDLTNCSELTTITINGQEYLPEIKLDGCTNLSNFEVTSCNSLTRVSMPNTKLKTFIMQDCNNIDYIDVSNTGYLDSLDLSGCASLRTLLMSGITSNKITELDVRDCVNLEKLDVSRCIYLNNIRFEDPSLIIYPGETNPATHLRLNTLVLNDSGIKTFQYGRNAKPNNLDLGKFILNSVVFRNCSNVQFINNINVEATSSNLEMFRGCGNLETISGRIKLIGSVGNTFYNCVKLRNLPTGDNQSLVLDLSEATSASEMFYNCKEMTWAQATYILKKMPNLKSAWRIFNGCTGDNFNGVISAETFRYLPEITNIDQWFYSCSKLQDIPITANDTGIFRYNTKLTNIYRPFPTNKISGIISYNFFANNPNLESISYLFESAKIAALQERPAGDNAPYLFKPCRAKLTTLEGTFDGCGAVFDLTTDNILEGCNNLINISNIFNNCKNFIRFHPDMLKGKNKLSIAFSAFSGCSNLISELPADFLKGCTSLQQIQGMFRNCSNLSGDLRTSFWEDAKGVIRADELFDGCGLLGGVQYGLQNIPADFFKGKYRLDTIARMFRNCTNMTFNLVDKWFKDCIGLKDVSQTFYNCSNIGGIIPENLFYIATIVDNGDGTTTEIPSSAMIETAYGMFNNCQGLTGTIPENLFSSFYNVRDLSDFFRDCRNIRGPIPPRLFRSCVNVASMNYMFHHCRYIGRYDDEFTTEDPYFCDPELFLTCVNLQSTANMFNMWDWGTNLKGEIPPGLFRTNSKLVDTTSMFAACGKLTGALSNTLFSSNNKLETVDSMFYGCTGLQVISPGIFTSQNNPLIKNFTSTFRSCTSLTGTIPNLWIQFPSATGLDCFTGCSAAIRSQAPAQYGGTMVTS